MASVDNSIGGAAGDASSGQEPIDVEPGSSRSPMDNEVRHFVFLLFWVQQEHSQPILLRWTRFEGPDWQTVLLYFSGPAQCDPFGLTSAPSFTIAFSPQTGDAQKV